MLAHRTTMQHDGFFECVHTCTAGCSCQLVLHACVWQRARVYGVRRWEEAQAQVLGVAGTNNAYR